MCVYIYRYFICINVIFIHLHSQLPGFVVVHPLLGFLGIRHRSNVPNGYTVPTFQIGHV